MLIYCSHKFGGKLENAKAIELKIKKLQSADPGNTYISPIHTFGFMYDTVSYEDGIDMCLDLLSKCDAMVVLSEESRGVKVEIDYCHANKIPVFRPSENFEEVLNGLQENLQQAYQRISN